MKVLLIEDNIQISANIVRYLAMKDITCESSQNGKDGLYKVLSHHYDVVILDINLPEINGLDVLKKIREKWSDTQIIMLTSNSTKQDIVGGLQLWADDYLTKPFDFEELLARIHSLNRRNLKNKSNILHFWKKYALDIEKTELMSGKQEIKLSPLEFNLLKYLAQNRGRTLSRQELYEKVWWEFDGDIMFSKTVDVYIWYLRKKLDSEVIQTIKGIWYKINQ